MDLQKVRNRAWLLVPPIVSVIAHALYALFCATTGRIGIVPYSTLFITYMASACLLVIGVISLLISDAKRDELKYYD